MTSYRLQLTLDGQALPQLTIDGDTTPDLAQAVHRHARGHLGSQTVTVRIAADGLSGDVVRGRTVCGEFVLQEERPAPSPAPRTADDGSPVVAHGFTMADLHKMAAAACRADRSLASDAHTRYSVAWSAIATALCEAQDPPQRNELVQVGWQAIYNEVREMRHTFGFRDKEGTNGVASSPRFVQYWTQPPSQPDGAIIERLAVGQILATLTESERAAVIALAVHDDYALGAQALGVKDGAFRARLIAARRRFRGHWFAPETAPPIKGTDRRIGSRTTPLATHCLNGHPMTGDNVRERPGRKPGHRKGRTCRTCEAASGKASKQRQKEMA